MALYADTGCDTRGNNVIIIAGDSRRCLWLRYRLHLFRQQSMTVHEIHLTGSGANSHIWRQIIADVMDCPLICLRHQETATGAAIQSMSCLQVSDNAMQSASTALSPFCPRSAQARPIHWLAARHTVPATVANVISTRLLYLQKKLSGRQKLSRS